MILVCHVVSQNHVIKESFDFIGKGIKISYHPAKIGSHIHCDSWDMMILFCHVILEDHEIKG